MRHPSPLLPASRQQCARCLLCRFRARVLPQRCAAAQADGEGRQRARGVTQRRVSNTRPRSVVHSKAGARASANLQRRCPAQGAGAFVGAQLARSSHHARQAPRAAHAGAHAVGLMSTATQPVSVGTRGIAGPFASEAAAAPCPRRWRSPAPAAAKVSSRRGACRGAQRGAGRVAQRAAARRAVRTRTHPRSARPAARRSRPPSATPGWRA
jgi:hypothetical protein